MTISSTTRTAGPFSGNNATTTFAFAFKVFQASDLQLVRTLTSTGVSTTLTITTDYTVSLNADQNSAPGGSVTLTNALATGYTLIVTSDIAALQSTDLTNQGGFYPQVITNALDKVTILVQQILNKVGRSLSFPLTDSTSLNNQLPGSSFRSNKALVFDELGNVGVSVDDYVNQATNSAASASAAASSATAASGSADSALTYLNNFKGQYYGPLSANPTVDPLGNALSAGDLYFNTAVPEMRVYNGSAWVAAYVSLGSALLSTNNLSDVSSAATARDNIGAITNGKAAALSMIFGG